MQGLVALSQWQPPVQAPTRILTWFFLAMAPDAALRPAADKVFETAWAAPAAALDRHGARE